MLRRVGWRVLCKPPTDRPWCKSVTVWRARGRGRRAHAWVACSLETSSPHPLLAAHSTNILECLALTTRQRSCLRMRYCRSSGSSCCFRHGKAAPLQPTHRCRGCHAFGWTWQRRGAPHAPGPNIDCVWPQQTDARYPGPRRWRLSVTQLRERGKRPGEHTPHRTVMLPM